jgi:hypothetical protein
MLVLGINAIHHDPAAALVADATRQTAAMCPCITLTQRNCSPASTSEPTASARNPTGSGAPIGRSTTRVSTGADDAAASPLRRHLLDDYAM